MIIYKKRQKKHANTMGEDTWLKKTWYICLQHGELQKTRKKYCKEHFESSSGTEIPILQKQEEYISFETILFTARNIRMQQFNDQTSIHV